MEAVAELPEAEAVAEIVVGPEAEVLAGSSEMLATPDALVVAVPLDGVMVAKAGSVTKVTTASGTLPPEALTTVAETVVGASLVIEVTDAPEELVNLKEMLLIAVLFGLAFELVPEAPPPEQPTKKAAKAPNIKTDKDIA